MRNLKKILALVLALVMSFSLVTTAGAFSDDGDITADYNDAIKVLNGLDVFKGYDNGATFQPKGNITRAEVAAIIYRIATGDVTDSQKDIYSSYGQFTDVLDGSWYAGYVNYCANAGYIKGRGNKIFDPQGQVTGYEALAMILRAIGYDKNSEFTGSNWQVRTASIANERGITKHVTSTQLGQAATREVVAEILFRSILANKVNFNANTLSYNQTTSSLGYDTFKLEEVTGVVVANEFADLYDTDVLANGKTDLEVKAGDIRHLDYTSELTDIGESRHAYIAQSKVLHLGDTGTNTVFETGAKLDISTDKKFEDESKLKKTDSTEFYVNFGRDGKYDSDYRIEFSVTFEKGEKGSTPKAVMEWFEEEYLDDTTIAKVMTKKTSSNDSVSITYEKIIRAETEITQDDLDVIKGIFAAADDYNDNRNVYDGVKGDVYVGTKSNQDRVDRTDDISNEISYKEFFKEYINTETWDRSWEESDNGEWAKIVDNNGDGKAEYAFLTEYWMDKATHTRTKDNSSTMEYNELDADDYDFRYLDGYEPVVGDIVLYTRIDGQALIQKVEPVKATVNYINFKDEIIRSTDSNEYGQSGIENDTELDQIITNMDEKVEYNLYQDKYGYVRAYELTNGSQYGLITELYYGHYQNGRFQTSKDLTVELRAGSDKINEYDVTNVGTSRYGNEFVGDMNWLELNNYFNKSLNTGDRFYNHYLNAYSDERFGSAKEDLAEKNVLQPATAHLGLNTEGSTQDWYFTNSRTNVAKYVMDGDDGVKISSVSEFATDKNNNRLYYYYENGTLKKGTEADARRVTNNENEIHPVYATDYIQLRIPTGTDAKLKADTRVFDIQLNGKNNICSDSTHESGILNGYVNAVHDTEFYIVSDGSRRVSYFTDYEKLPEIAASKIEAMYAVARNTESDNTSKDYWVADVIVIEVNNWNEDYDSISLAYFTNNYNGGTVRSLDTLNNKAAEKMQTVKPDAKDYAWDIRDWSNHDYGFYKLYDTTVDGDTTTADDIEKITSKFYDYDIFAGEITRISVIDSTSRDNYIMVDIGEASDKYVDVDNASVYEIKYERNQANWKNIAEELHMCSTAHSDVKEGDRIIWIGDDDAIFIVVVSFTDNGEYTSPSWLYGSDTSLYRAIYADKNGYAMNDDTFTVTSYNKDTKALAGRVNNGANYFDITLPKDVTPTAVGWTFSKGGEDSYGNIIWNATRNDGNTSNDVTITWGTDTPNPDTYDVDVKFVDTEGTEITGIEVSGNTGIVSGANATIKLTVDSTKYTVESVSDNATLSEDKTTVTVENVTSNITVTVTLKKSEGGEDETALVTFTITDATVTIGDDVLTENGVRSFTVGETVTFTAEPTGENNTWIDTNAEKTENENEYSFVVPEGGTTIRVTGKPPVEDVTVTLQRATTTPDFDPEKDIEATIEITDDEGVITIQGAGMTEQWYHIQVGSTINGVIECVDNTVSFPYTLEEADITEGSILVKIDYFVPTGEPENGKLWGVSLLTGGWVEYPIIGAKPIHAGARAIVVENTMDKGDYWSIGMNDETLYGVVDMDGENKGVFFTGESLLKLIKILQSGEGLKVDPTSAEPHPTVTGDAGLTTSEDGSTLVLDLKKPQAQGVKLPSTVEIENGVTVDVEWFYGDSTEPLPTPAYADEKDLSLYHYTWNTSDIVDGNNAITYPVTVVTQAKDEENITYVIQDETTFTETGVAFDENGKTIPTEDGKVEEVVKGYTGTLTVTYGEETLDTFTATAGEDDTEIAFTVTLTEDYRLAETDTTTADPKIVKNEDGTYTVTYKIEATDENVIEETLEAEKDRKLFVKTVDEKEKLLDKFAFELQENVAVTEADGVYTVTGDTNYITAWNSWETGASGYFIALEIGGTDAVGGEIKFESRGGATGGPNAGWKDLPIENEETCSSILVWKITEKDDGTIKPINIKFDGKEYTIDLNGVNRGKDTDVLSVEVAAPAGNIVFGSTDSEKKVSDLHEQITVGKLDTATSTIKVSGSTKPVMSWTQWGDAQGTTSFFVALKLTYPVEGAKIYFKSVDGTLNESGTTSPSGGAYKELDTDGILVWKLSNDDNNVRKNIEVSVAGKKYIIDLSGVKEGPKADSMTVKPVAGDVKVLEKLTSDVQTGVEIEKIDDTHFKATGTLKYVTGWTQWDGTTVANRSGYYINLEFSHSGINAWEDMTVGNNNTPFKGDGILSKKVTPGETKDVTVKVKGVKYIVDLSALKFEDHLEIDATAPTTTLGSVWSSVKISDLNDITVTRREGTDIFDVTGTVNYYSPMAGFSGDQASGYYIVLDFKAADLSETNDVMVMHQDAATEQNPGVGVNNDNIVRRLSMTGKKPKNITVKAYGKEFTLDVSGLTLVDKPTVDVTKLSEIAFDGQSDWTKKVADLQSDVKVVPDEENKTFYVTGKIKKVENWGAYPANENTGWFIALDWTYVGGKFGWYTELVDPRWLGESVQTDTIITRIAGTDGVKHNAEIVTATEDNWIVDFSGVTLEGAPASAAAVALNDEPEVINEIVDNVVDVPSEELEEVE